MGLQLREDVTRFRYGDEQHLDDTLTRLFQFNRPKGVPRRCACDTCTIHVGTSSCVKSYCNMKVHAWP